MRLKKSVFGYINFTIGIIIMSVYLYTLFVSLLRIAEKSIGKRVLLFGVSLSQIGGVLIVPAVIGLIFLLISDRVAKKLGERGIW